MDLSPEELLDQAKRIQKSLEKLQQTQEKAKNFFTGCPSAWNKVVDWFKGCSERSSFGFHGGVAEGGRPYPHFFS